MLDLQFNGISIERTSRNGPFDGVNHYVYFYENGIAWTGVVAPGGAYQFFGDQSFRWITDEQRKDHSVSARMGKQLATIFVECNGGAREMKVVYLRDDASNTMQLVEVEQEAEDKPRNKYVDLIIGTLVLLAVVAVIVFAFDILAQNAAPIELPRLDRWLRQVAVAIRAFIAQ